MSSRVSPTDPIHAKIDTLFAEERPLPEILEEMARLGAQLRNGSSPVSWEGGVREDRVHEAA